MKQSQKAQPKKPKPKKSSSKYAGMSRAERNKLIGSLGGQARARNLTADEKAKISSKGGLVTYLRHGSEYYSTMSKSRWEKMSPSEQEAWLANIAKGREKYLGKKKRQAALDKVNKAKRSTSSNES